MNRNGKGNGAEGSKWGRHPKESCKSHCVMVRFDNEEWLKFLSMHEKSGVYARAVFLKAHFSGSPSGYWSRTGRCWITVRSSPLSMRSTAW